MAVSSSVVSLESLLTDPEHGKTYKEILKFCTTPRTKDEIEKMVLEDLKVTYETAKVWPAFFIAQLEKAGGLHWVGKWEATETAKKTV